ncbi:MAG: hypothetical protein R3C53_01975 [Pirellulaceae bacterium]
MLFSGNSLYRRSVVFCCGALAALCAAILPSHRCAAQARGAIFIDFIEEGTDDLLPCRVQVRDARGRAARPRGVLVQGEWSLIEGTLEFRGREGDYTYQVAHGPQFSPGSGGFKLDRNATAQDAVQLKRHASLDAEGWYGGDLLSHVEPDKTLRWLPAEDLTMAAVVCQKWSPERESATDEPAADATRQVAASRWTNDASYHDSRPGSGLIIHHWLPPAQVPDSLPSSRLLVLAKQQPPPPGQLPVHVEIQKLWARDVPIWLASERIDSIQLLSSHITLDGETQEQVNPLEVPEGRFRGPTGPGKMVERIYWQRSRLVFAFRRLPAAGSERRRHRWGQTASMQQLLPAIIRKLVPVLVRPDGGKQFAPVAALLPVDHCCEPRSTSNGQGMYSVFPATAS